MYRSDGSNRMSPSRERRGGGGGHFQRRQRLQRRSRRNESQGDPLPVIPLAVDRLIATASAAAVTGRRAPPRPASSRRAGRERARERCANSSESRTCHGRGGLGRGARRGRRWSLVFLAAVPSPIELRADAKLMSVQGGRAPHPPTAATDASLF